jgi:hypothetical protein
MTGPLIKQEVPPACETKDVTLPVLLTGYIQYAFPGDLYDIDKYSPYGQFIDYTFVNEYPPSQYIDPAATIYSSSQVSSPSIGPYSPVSSPPKLTVVCKEKKRTPTSYDKETSRYLKSVFFDVYSKQNKLTKNQRQQVREKTDLPPRKITYWFSNHKRRFKKALEIYKDAVKDSHGKITCYEDFVLWRRSQDLPDDVTRSEMERLN